MGSPAVHQRPRTDPRSALATEEHHHTDGAGPPPSRRRQLPTLELLALFLVLAVVFRSRLEGLFTDPGLQTFSTIFVSITIQALPVLVLGIIVSGGIAALLPPGLLGRLLPRTGLAVPIAGLAGVALPGCECGSVPIAGRLTARGAMPAAAFAFMLSAPAINPIVLVATAVAFPGQPLVVAGRPPATTQTEYGSLPEATNGAVELPLSDYVFPLYDQQESLTGARVRLTGFVTPTEEGDGYTLTRFVLNCCAADGTAVRVAVVGDDVERAPDTWLAVEGTWEPGPDRQPGEVVLEPPVIIADTVTEIDQPEQPYEY